MKQPKFWQPVYRMTPRNPTPKPQTPSPPTPHPLTPTIPYPLTPTPIPDPHYPLTPPPLPPWPPPPPGRVLCTVLVTIPWAGPLSLIEFHSIDKKASYHSTYFYTLYMRKPNGSILCLKTSESIEKKKVKEGIISAQYLGWLHKWTNISFTITKCLFKAGICPWIIHFWNSDF